MTTGSSPAEETPTGILILSLASACACRCVFCGLPDSQPHTIMDRRTLIAALDGTPTPARWAEVNLTGGDPLVVPGARALFGEVLARRHRLARLSVSTAGIPAPTAIRGLTMLADGSPLDVYVSLDGVGELHDKSVGGWERSPGLTRFSGSRRGVRA